MKIYLIDDDKNVLNILNLIISERKLGTVCQTAENGHDALDDVADLRPDLIIIDLLMPDMDGITFVEKVKQHLPDTAFVMLSQVSSKEMIAAAYQAGIEFYIQKPINSIEVENVITKVMHSLSMKRTLTKMQNIFMEETQSSPTVSNDLKPSSNKGSSRLLDILQRLGISGDIGSRDILLVAEYLISHPEQMEYTTLNELCSRFSDSPKSMEQRIRRTANTGLVNLAHLGIEDYGNDVFNEYSNTLYNFEQVRKEMDYIRGKSNKHGNVKIRSFLNALVLYSLNP